MIILGVSALTIMSVSAYSLSGFLTINKSGGNSGLTNLEIKPTVSGSGANSTSNQTIKNNNSTTNQTNTNNSNSNPDNNSSNDTKSNPPANYTLTIEQPEGSGKTSKTGVTQYPDGYIVTVIATPSTGWVFDRWTLDDSKSVSGNPLTLIMNTTHTLKALFTQRQFNLTIASVGSGETNPSVGTHSYINGTRVQCTATPPLAGCLTAGP